MCDTVCNVLKVLPFGSLPTFLKSMQCTHRRCLKARLNDLVPTENVQMVHFVQNHPVEKILKDALQNSDCGVYALWSPKESGSTSYVRNMSMRLRQEQIIAYLDGTTFDKGHCLTPKQWFMESLQIDTAYRLNFETLFPSIDDSGDEGCCGSVFGWQRATNEKKNDDGDDDALTKTKIRKPPVGIVLDHFDMLMRNCEEDAMDLLLMLQSKSRSHGRFSVLICVKDHVKISTVCTVARLLTTPKIKKGTVLHVENSMLMNTDRYEDSEVETAAVLQWEREHVLELYEKLSKHYGRTEGTAWSDELGKIASTPGLVVNAFRQRPAHRKTMIAEALAMLKLWES